MRGLRPYNMRSILLQEREFNQIMEGLTVGNCYPRSQEQICHIRTLALIA